MVPPVQSNHNKLWALDALSIIIIDFSAIPILCCFWCKMLPTVCYQDLTHSPREEAIATHLCLIRRIIEALFS